ncbi:MAG: hypothetical protein IJ442_02030 [Bacteroidaceae bacterium]|nr:hypothetical protein [Bacteroidaceae bacterium]
MKKLVLFFAVAAAVSFAACTNKPAEATEETVDSVAVEAVCDSCATACDSCTVACDSCTVACDSCKVACDSCKVAE